VSKQEELPLAEYVSGSLFNAKPFVFEPIELFEMYSVPVKERFTITLKPLNYHQRETLRKINSEIRKEVYDSVSKEFGFKGFSDLQSATREMTISKEYVSDHIKLLGFTDENGDFHEAKFIIDGKKVYPDWYEKYSNAISDTAKVNECYRSINTAETQYILYRHAETMAEMILEQIVSSAGQWLAPNADGSALVPVDSVGALLRFPPLLFTLIWNKLSDISELSYVERIAL
jgi:hypothetical protein